MRAAEVFYLQHVQGVSTGRRTQCAAGPKVSHPLFAEIGVFDLGSVEKYIDQTLFQSRRNHDLVAYLMFELDTDQCIKIIFFPRIVDHSVDQLQNPVQHLAVFSLKKIGLVSAHDGLKHSVGTRIVSLLIFGVDHEPNLLGSCHVLGKGKVVYVIFNEKGRVPCIFLGAHVGHVGLGAVGRCECLLAFTDFVHGSVLCSVLVSGGRRWHPALQIPSFFRGTSGTRPLGYQNLIRV